MKPQIPMAEGDDFPEPHMEERRPVEGAGCVWAVVCGVPLFVALVALVAAVWPA